MSENISTTIWKSPDWFKGACIYQVNLRNFTPDGTLKSAEKLLPYLADLGIDILYLTPIVQSDKGEDKTYWSTRAKTSGFDNAKNPYRISDYFKIDDEYGNDEDLTSFVKSAHEVGLKIMLDLVYMHCGPNAVFIKEHPDFVQRDENGNMKLTIYNFPLINFESSELRDYLWFNMEYFVKRFNIDGYRVDVGDSVPLDFWEEGVKRCRTVKPEFLMLNEGRKPEYLSVFDSNYGQRWIQPLFRSLKYLEPLAAIRAGWQKDEDQLPPGYCVLRAVENHDYANDAKYERLEAVRGGAAGEVAIVVNFMTNGLPFLYHGNELGDSRMSCMFYNRYMRGTSGVDWALALTEYGKYRLELTKKLIALRHTEKALRYGNLTWINSTDDEKILAFMRVHEGETIIFAANMRPEATCEVLDISAESAVNVLSKGAVITCENKLTLSMEPYGYIVLKK